LIAYKKTKLPLSIGIFGHWGSGKTFFLNTVKRSLGDLKGDDYYQNVVPIDFNAWHYMETNIWASLVSVIFKELLAAQKDETQKTSTLKMMDALATAQDSQLDALEALVKRHKEASNAQDELVEAVQKGHDASAKGSVMIASAIFHEVKEARKADFERLEAALADDGQFNTVGEKKSRKAQLAGIEREKNIFEFLDAAGEMISSGRLLRANMQKVLWSPLLLLPAAAVLVAAPFGFSYLAEAMGRYQFLSSSMAPVVATLTGAAGSAGIWIKQITDATKTAYEAIEKATEANSRYEEFFKARAEEDLKVEAARSRYEVRAKAADTAREQLLSQSVLGRMDQLIRARAEGDTYTKHLGVIATIRSDFEQLSMHLAKSEEREKEAKTWAQIKKEAIARLDALVADAGDVIGKDLSRLARLKRLEAEAIDRDRGLPEAFHEPAARPEDGIDLTNHGQAIEDVIEDARQKINDYIPANNIDRIVLFIDDLDRCPPDKVYDVLQAVHLFLSFPLFVAMVGVDTRWMETALEKQLEDLVSGKNGATPRDYLEKIFQIPYWAKSLQPTQAQDFIGNLLDDINKRLEPAKPAEPVDDQNSGAGEDDAADDTKNEGKNEPVVDGPDPDGPEPEGPEPEGPVPEGPPPSEDSDDNTPPDEAPEFAAPTEDEAAYLKEVGGFAGTTPRRVIRFLNVFLLIKTLPEGQQGIDRQRAIITQLALCVGSPELAGAYFDALERANVGDNVEAFKTALAKRVAASDAGTEAEATVTDLFDIYAKTAGANAVEILKDTAPIARKFTFASPEAVEVETTGDGEMP
jgi:hypothetical protein